MFAKVFCFVFLLFCFVTLFPQTECNVLTSTYGYYSKDPTFAAGMRQVQDVWKDFTHSGYGPVDNNVMGTA